MILTNTPDKKGDLVESENDIFEKFASAKCCSITNNAEFCEEQIKKLK